MSRPPAPAALRAALLRLDIDQKRSLLAWFQEAIALEEQQILLEKLQSQNATIGEQRHFEGKLYQQEKRRCGKSGCRCMNGNLLEVGHGPYWYAYWREQGKLRSRYVGKRVPWGQE